MSVTNWNLTYIDGKPFLVIDVAKFRIPLDWDPSSNMFIAVAAPDGGLGNFPALVKGDDGDSPTIDSSILFEAMDYDDPGEEYASFDEITPGVFQLSLGLRRGEPGSDGVMVLDPEDYGTPVAKSQFVLNASGDGFEYVAQKVGNRYLPASINPTPNGNPGFTQCTIGIPAQPFDYHLSMEGQSVLLGTSTDFRGNLVARLGYTGVANAETAGPICGLGFGPIGNNVAGIATVLSGSPPAGSSSAYDKVAAGVAATVYCRGERQAGSGTFTSDASTSVWKAKVEPIGPYA